MASQGARCQGMRVPARICGLQPPQSCLPPESALPGSCSRAHAPPQHLVPLAHIVSSWCRPCRSCSRASLSCSCAAAPASRCDSSFSTSSRTPVPRTQPLQPQWRSSRAAEELKGSGSDGGAVEEDAVVGEVAPPGWGKELLG